MKGLFPHYKYIYIITIINKKVIGVCIDTCVFYQSVLEKKTYESQI